MLMIIIVILLICVLISQQEQTKQIQRNGLTPAERAREDKELLEEIEANNRLYI